MQAQDHHKNHHRRATIIWVGKDSHVETSAAIIAWLEQLCPPNLVCEGEAIWILEGCRNLPTRMPTPKKRMVNDAA